MKTHLTLTFCLLLLTAGAALAQTPAPIPNGSWPFENTVCDDQTGAAYGLCLAYCEAMECDLANDLNSETAPNAPFRTCNKVRNVFKRIAGDDMPCECPCWDDPNLPLWSEYLAGEAEPDACFLDADVCAIAGAPPEFCTPPQGDAHLIVFDGGERSMQFTSLGVNPGVFPPSCGQGGAGGGPDHLVSPSQGAVCKVQLNTILAESRLHCGF